MMPQSEMALKPERKKGLARILAAFFYSLNGLRHAITRESAFIQEVAVFAVASLVLLWLPLSLLWKGLLLTATAFVLIVELLNTAVEATVDLASPDYHELAKCAKDIGSAAVLLSIVVAVLLWGMALSTLF